MRVTVVPRIVLHLPYQAVRLPIAVLDTQVLGRYRSAESVLRLPLERVLGSLTAAAGRLLDDPTRQQADSARRPLASASPHAAQMQHHPHHPHGQQQPTAAAGPAGGYCDYRDDAAAARGDEQAAIRRAAEQAHAGAAAEKDRTDAAARALRRMADS